VAAARELATQASTGQLVITFFMLGQSSELQLSKSRGCILWWDTFVCCFSSFVERKYLKDGCTVSFEDNTFANCYLLD
jgi:hypothetical protein